MDSKVKTVLIYGSVALAAIAAWRHFKGTKGLILDREVDQLIADNPDLF